MKHKVILALLVIGLASYSWMELIHLPSQEKIQAEENLKQLHPETHNFEKVRIHENLYMGNASNTSQLFRNLPLSQRVESFEMDPDQLLLIVKYHDPKNESERLVQQSVIYNTTAAFVLIKNLQQVEIRFPNASFIINRKNVEKWFGTDFLALIEPVEFKKKVQEPLKNENLEEWLTAYSEEGI